MCCGPRSPELLLTCLSVTFASIYRATTIAGSASNRDPTWGPIPATIWSVIEANAGIVCACLPMLRAPFVRLFGPLLGSALAMKSSTKRSSYPLNHAHGKAGADHRSGMSHGKSRSGRDSVDSILENGGAPFMQGRRRSGIFVTNEFSVESNALQLQETVSKSNSHMDETNTTGSINEDKADGRNPFYHV